jgi:hypothetical protein
MKTTWSHIWYIGRMEKITQSQVAHVLVVFCFLDGPRTHIKQFLYSHGQVVYNR